VTDNRVGLFQFDGTENNIIHHNSLINNSIQVLVEDLAKTSADIWDDGYPSGGNYWSNYGGTDLLQGSFQNEAGTDGIGDTPHVMNTWNQDNYPLTQPPQSPILCDINYDGKVNMKDTAYVALAFGSSPAHPRWKPEADIYHDLKIDLRDIATVARNFG